MLIDLRYALGQLSRALDATTHAGCDDCINRAVDALERCVEAAQAAEDAMDHLEEADLDAIFSRDELEAGELVSLELGYDDEFAAECSEMASAMPCECDYHTSQREWTADEILAREG